MSLIWVYETITPASAFSSLILMISIIMAQNKEHVLMKKDQMANIFWMSFCDLGLSLRGLIQFIPYVLKMDKYCWISGFGGVFFVVAIHCWYFIIAFQILVTTHSISITRCTEGKRFMYHIFAWGLSFILASVPLNHYHIQSLTNTCWFRDLWFGEMLVFLEHTIFLGFAILLLLIMALTLFSQLSQREGRILLMRASVFVIVFVITWLPSWIEIAFDMSLQTVPLLISQGSSICASSSGTLNLFVWLVFFPDIFNKAKPQKNEEDETDIPYSSFREVTESKTSIQQRISSDFTGTYQGSGSDQEGLLLINSFSNQEHHEH